jgi:hypothetical protein
MDARELTRPATVYDDKLYAFLCDVIGGQALRRWHGPWTRFVCAVLTQAIDAVLHRDPGTTASRQSPDSCKVLMNIRTQETWEQNLPERYSITKRHAPLLAPHRRLDRISCPSPHQVRIAKTQALNEAY